MRASYSSSIQEQEGSNAFEVTDSFFQPGSSSGQGVGFSWETSHLDHQALYSPPALSFYHLFSEPVHRAGENRLISPFLLEDQVPSTEAGPNVFLVEDARDPPHHLLPSPIDVTSDQEATQVSVEQSPARTDGAGIQGSGKRKRATSHKRTRRKKPRIEPQEHIPPDPNARLATRPELLAVDQTKYQCETVQNGRKLLPPIVFSVNGKEGVNLVDAIDNHFSGLDGRDDYMFTNRYIGSCISLRIELVGYQGRLKAKQISTRNHKKEHSSITRQKLVHDVAKMIKLHLLSGDGSFPIAFGKMFLVKLHNVSLASWQPELWHEAPTSTTSGKDPHHSTPLR